jgi:radical SAM protein with 4Fe4S-binding SPASM domain
VGFTTNGFYLDQNIADDMKNYGVDAINISIYTREEHERLSKIKFNIPVEFRDYIDMSNQDGRADCYADSDKPAAKCKAAAPLFNIIINHNGDVCLCCIDWQYRYTFGNVLHEPLIKIINKPEFLKMSKLTSDGKQDLTCCKNCTGQYLARLPEQTVLFHPQHQWD